MQTKSWLILSTVILILGLAIGRYSLPARIETKEVIKTITVEKKTDDKVTTKNNDKVLVTTVTKFPDGRIVTETKLVDKSTTTVVDNKKDNIDTKTEDSKESTTIYEVNRYHLGLMAGKDITDLTKAPTFGIELDKKFIGPISLGVYGQTDKTLGLLIGLSF